MSDAPERTKLLRGQRWPKDSQGGEIDVGDYLMFVHWDGYPTARIGQVSRVGKTGKVHVEVVRTSPGQTLREVEVKECRSTTKLSQNMINAMVLDKLSRPF